ncbi:TrmB family transcriptional regulator [Anaeromicropila populeti]|uniref:Sugar-specific transcriptional regulator TrmB n=1 Tax=Anaeromicropila populeti TaxID=37658 RepID=A0A1I6HX89_9FIRM|nr:TrmB family transcriptional regulator [Anaeromicropila populeti]SFR59063.1 Sugar-specific transcriptional regulator TrmB [Anaeromicropila populeti]
MEFIELLTNFGLTRQEASIYVALLTNGESSGYETAKLTGISRSNTYNGLAGLVEKGAAYVIEGVVVKYMAVDVENFSNNKIRELQRIQKRLLHLAPEPRIESDGYITIKGEKHIKNQIENMLDRAEKRVYLSVGQSLLGILEEQLRELSRKGLKVVVITDKKGFSLESVTTYYNVRREKQIGIIVDSIEVLTGEMEEGDNATCLYSKNKNLIDVFKEMLKNEIKLLEMQGGTNI